MAKENDLIWNSALTIPIELNPDSAYKCYTYPPVCTHDCRAWLTIKTQTYTLYTSVALCCILMLIHLFITTIYFYFLFNANKKWTASNFCMHNTLMYEQANRSVSLETSVSRMCLLFIFWMAARVANYIYKNVGFILRQNKSVVLKLCTSSWDRNVIMEKRKKNKNKKR